MDERVIPATGKAVLDFINECIRLEKDKLLKYYLEYDDVTKAEELIKKNQISAKKLRYLLEHQKDIEEHDQIKKDLNEVVRLIDFFQGIKKNSDTQTGAVVKRFAFNARELQRSDLLIKLKKVSQRTKEAHAQLHQIDLSLFRDALLEENLSELNQEIKRKGRLLHQQKAVLMAIEKKLNEELPPSKSEVEKLTEELEKLRINTAVVTEELAALTHQVVDSLPKIREQLASELAEIKSKIGSSKDILELGGNATAIESKQQKIEAADRLLSQIINH